MDNLSVIMGSGYGSVLYTASRKANSSSLKRLDRDFLASVLSWIASAALLLLVVLRIGWVTVDVSDEDVMDLVESTERTDDDLRFLGDGERFSAKYSWVGED